MKDANGRLVKSVDVTVDNVGSVFKKPTLANSIYLIASLRNKRVPLIGNDLRKLGLDVFDDWWGVGPEADDFWQAYEKTRGRSYKDAIAGRANINTFNFDHSNMDRTDMGVLIMPAGKSAHLELGYMIGQGKKGFVLFEEEPERWDAMYRFATEVFFDYDEFLAAMKKEV